MSTWTETIQWGETLNAIPESSGWRIETLEHQVEQREDTFWRWAGCVSSSRCWKGLVCSQIPPSPPPPLHSVQSVGVLKCSNFSIFSVHIWNVLSQRHCWISEHMRSEMTLCEFKSCSARYEARARSMLRNLFKPQSCPTYKDMLFLRRLRGLSDVVHKSA